MNYWNRALIAILEYQANLSFPYSSLKRLNTIKSKKP